MWCNSSNTKLKHNLSFFVQQEALFGWKGIASRASSSNSPGPTSIAKETNQIKWNVNIWWMNSIFTACTRHTNCTHCVLLWREHKDCYKKKKKLYPHSVLVSKCISYIRISAGSDISSYDMNFLSHKLRFTGEIFERTVCSGYVNECLRFTVHNWGTEAGAEANVKVAFERLFLLISQASLTTKPLSTSQ